MIQGTGWVLRKDLLSNRAHHVDFRLVQDTQFCAIHIEDRMQFLGRYLHMIKYEKEKRMEYCNTPVSIRTTPSLLGNCQALLQSSQGRWVSGLKVNREGHTTGFLHKTFSQPREVMGINGYEIDQIMRSS